MDITQENSLSEIPPEVWERITLNVQSSKDLINLSKVIPMCKNLLYPKRVEWLFYQVLPVLVTNSYGKWTMPTQSDLLNCRFVCKHWKFGVDNFYVNNVLHYPASGDNVDWKLNKCHFGETTYLNGSGILCKKFKTSKIKKMLSGAVNYPHNPIIGGYVYLEITEVEEKYNLVELFLKTFGLYVYFLRLDFDYGFDPIKFITFLVHLLPNLPNLKGLYIHKMNFDLDSDEKKHISIDHIKEEFNKINFNENFKSKLPKLETLNLQISGSVGDILKQTIFNKYNLESLKNLTLLEFVSSNNLTFDLSNVLHLCLSIDNNEQLKSVLDFNFCKVRKLDLELMYDELDYDLLFQLLQKFRSSINHLSLHLPDCLEIVSKTEQKKMVRFFTTPNILKMPNIKTISLFGWRPPSLNFICGENFTSLEYLNLYLENGEEDENSLLKYPLDNGQCEEITDVIKLLNPMWSECGSWTQPELYKSNLWNVFPKLKSLFVARYDYWQPLRQNGWTYRRNNLEMA